MFGQAYHASQLWLVARPDPINEIEYSIGRAVRLNSGGPDMLIVDRAHDHVTVAWRSGRLAKEKKLPLAALQLIETTAF